MSADPPITPGLPTRRGVNRFIPVIDQTTARNATCDCGKPFTQARISEAWMDALAENYSRAAVAIAKNHPDLYTPARCPSCERKQIALEAQRDRIFSSGERYERASVRGDSAA